MDCRVAYLLRLSKIVKVTMEIAVIHCNGSSKKKCQLS